jgi:hypothetical protein
VETNEDVGRVAVNRNSSVDVEEEEGRQDARCVREFGLAFKRTSGPAPCPQGYRARVTAAAMELSRAETTQNEARSGRQHTHFSSGSSRLFLLIGFCSATQAI